MKRTVRILALLFSVLFLSACAGERLADSSVDEGLLNTYDGISVRTEQSEYPVGTKEIRLVLVNNTEEKTGGYGEDFLLEVERGGVWKEVPFAEYGDHFNEIENLLLPGQETHETIDLGRFDFSWKPGKYRVIKEFYLHSDFAPSEAHLFSAEFMLTEE